ncbi:hypothetical protein MYCTH_2122102 [Thermothelomyces thermophilus ATCC 42464]|uniref:Helix-turn-helix domain-containing protein n=1 Tax=Thermothelomyces thermophilus (strain ATCC 42464 / BCRC 31852 / DSM 1799) TaxID=573729 RepID=G2Q0W4_THET4|nr:uncharacterized protein MYCTH_2122102 [Thermothelomyces thermophilus ATCC 42464]AEO53264.1 hypothetical protein MYCTH_2122102 [Thermothelomyces thermophilus ATCC 42464]
MGASGSKAAQRTVRKFPSRAPGSSPAATTNPMTRPARRPPPAPSEDVQPRSQRQAFYTKDDAIRADSTDPDGTELSPDFAARLQKMGIVQPNPTYSPSSIASPFPDVSGIRQSVSTPQYPASSNNATLGVLEVRRQLEARAREELENTGKSTDKGREFLDIGTIRQILVLRQGGASPADIEARLRLKPGVVERFGPQGVVAPAS